MAASNDYYFTSEWRVKGTVKEVADILNDLLALVDWWPSVYLEIKELNPGDKDGVGRRVELVTKGWLPYTIKWQFAVTESRYPYGSTIQAYGDFDGVGNWYFEQEGEWVKMTYDWRIKAEKPLFRMFSFMLKPIFSANHRWAMARGEESLKLELERRHATTSADAARIPQPPPPTFPHRGEYLKRRAQSQLSGK